MFQSTKWQIQEEKKKEQKYWFSSVCC